MTTGGNNVMTTGYAINRLAGTAPVQRRRIWELDAGRHCSVLGTCLSLQDLHVIARRARYHVEPNVSAYALHSWFVDMVACPNDLAKLVDKELEKRHGKAAGAVRRAQTEREIETQWKEVTAQGHIAGAFWGAMSHPLCSDDLQWKLFGEIHMLSHLVGSSRRFDLARVHDLEVSCAALDGSLAQLKHDHRASLKERKRLEDDLTSRRRVGDLAERLLTSALRRIEDLESITRAGELERRNEALERELRDALEHARAAESALATNQTLVEALREHGRRDEVSWS